ncbi:hypothetical protein [Paenibacillus marinisediminis]
MNNHRAWWKRLSWLSLIGVILLTGCSQASESQPLTSLTAADTKTLPEVTVVIDGGSYVPNITERITIEWKQGMTVSQALAHTGIVKLKNDSSGIASVGDISLDPKMTWGLMLNDYNIRQKEKLAQPIKENDQLTVYVKELEVDTSSAIIPSVTLTIDGGTALPDITSTYAMPLEQEVKLVDVLKEFGNITLSEDSKDIIKINGFSLKDNYAVELMMNDQPFQITEMSAIRVEPDDNITIKVSKN